MNLPASLSFRPLRADDLPLLHTWLNEPGVVRFWEGDDVSWDAVSTEHGPDSDEDTEEWLALDGQNPVGWIQCYAVADYLDEDETQAWLRLGYPTTGAGIDYLIGDASRRGMGLGTEMIRTFIATVVWPHAKQWTHVAASPVRENGASCSALQRAGLSLFGSFEDLEFGPCDLFTMKRPAKREPTET